MTASSTSTVCSRGMNTPTSREMRGVLVIPPPMRNAKPCRPSFSVAIRATSEISGALHCAVHAEIVYLCLRGRFENSRLP